MPSARMRGGRAGMKAVMSEDTIFREVDEAVRQDQLKSLWNKYGVLVLAAGLLIVVGVAGYKGWVYWRDKQASEAGSRFVGALQLAESGKEQEARAAFEDLAKDGPSGYRVLSLFQLAAAEASSGDKAKAVADYDALAGDSSVEPMLQGYAKIRAATLRVDEADKAEIARRVGDLAAAGPWRHSARELLGLASYKAGDMQEAQRQFSELLSDPTAPQSLRRRAEMMLALIVKADAAPTQ